MPLLNGLRLERARASQQYREGAFRNTSRLGAGLKGPTPALLGEFLFAGHKRTPKAPLPVERPHAQWARPLSPSGLRVTWLGHSTLLLEVDGFRVLTDPVFGEHASPVAFGAKRFHPVPARISELPPLDAVVVSHDHYDHLCAPSMRELARLRVPVITALGVGARLERFGVDPRMIVELDWWEEHSLAGGKLAFAATPSQHFSGRSLLDRNHTLWASWVILTDHHRLFFSGDTGLTDEFREVHRRYGRFDLTMLEIGAWNAAWGDIHLGPKNALAAFEMLGGGTLLPVHWSTFDLGLHAWDEPAETLIRLADAASARVLTPLIGRPFEPRQLEGPNPWWRSVRAEEGEQQQPGGWLASSVDDASR